MKKIISLLIAFSILFISPQFVFAVEESYSEKSEVKIENSAVRKVYDPQIPVSASQKWSGSYVYFGNYMAGKVDDRDLLEILGKAEYDIQNCTAIDGITYKKIVEGEKASYYIWSPLRWQVLQTTDDELFLLSEKIVAAQQFDDRSSDADELKWRNSDLRAWLADDFYNMAFNEKEQDAILTKTLSNETGTELSGGGDTQDKVFVPSIWDMMNPSYGFWSGTEASPTRVAQYLPDVNLKVTTWTASYNESTIFNDAEQACYYWTRTPRQTRYGFMMNPGFVSAYGSVVSNNNVAQTWYLGIRPAVYISKESDQWYTNLQDSPYAETVAEPEADIKGGNYSEDQTVHLSCETEGASIYFTLDGTEPTVESGMLYETPINIRGDMTLKAIAVKEGQKNSSVLTERYEFSKTSSEISIDGIKIGEDKSGKLNDKDAGSFFPTNFRLASAIIPVKASCEEQADGSYKLKASIGTRTLFDSEEEWSHYKKSVDRLAESGLTSKGAGKLFDSFDAEKIKTVDIQERGKFPKLSVLGYGEAVVDRNGNVIESTAKIKADADWKDDMTKQFFTPVGPFYINVSGGVKLEWDTSPALSLSENAAWKINLLDNKLTLKPNIALEGGYGISKIATIGAKGKAEFPIQIEPASKMDFEGKASVHAYIIFVLDLEYDFWTPKVNIWDTTGTKASSKAMAVYAGDLGEVIEDLELVDRAYAEYTTEWQGDIEGGNASNASGRMRSAAVTKAQEGKEYILQSGVMPNTLPNISKIGNETVMIFQENAEERETLDSSRLMYSVYDGNSWSDPEPVWETGTSDFYADMQVIGDGLYVVWQKEKDHISSSEENMETVLDEMAQKSEICFARYDKQIRGFTDCQYITSDQNVDMMPKLAQGEENVTVAWVSNNSNSLIQDEGENEIRYATYEEGSFGETHTLYKTETAIEEIVPFYRGGELNAGVITNASLDAGTNQVLILGEGKEDEISDGNVPVSNLQYCSGALYYVQDGVMQEYQLDEKALAAVTAGNSPVGSNAKIHVNNNKAVIVWSKSNEEGTSDLLASVKTEKGFAEPITLHTSQGTICYMDSVLLQDGTWQFVLNTENSSSGTELHSLAFVTYAGGKQIDVEDVVIDSATGEGGETKVSYIVTNTGEETVNELLMTVSIDGREDIQQEIEVNLAPGETVQGTATVYIPDITETLDAAVSICTGEEAVIEAEKVPVKVGQTDLSLNTSIAETQTEAYLVVDVVNESNVPSEAVLEVHNDTESRRASESIPLGVIAAGESVSKTIRIDKKSLVMNEAGAVYFSVGVAADQSDNNLYNNTAVEAVYENMAESVTKGDINADQAINLADLMLCLHHVSGGDTLEDKALKAADLDDSGAVDLVDLMRLLHYVSGSSDQL